MTIELAVRQTGKVATARWADPDHIASTFAYGPGAFWLGRLAGNEEAAIGYRGDRHIFLCAETRSGKGRAFIVNNLITWPGNLVSIDPKGENATITAARRGPGEDGYCDGMGQDVFVLDPFECAKVGEHLRGYFNPLDPREWPESEEDYLDYANMLAEAICVIPESGDSQTWAQRGRTFIATIILHVMTADGINVRDLVTVRELILAGMDAEARALAEDGVTVSGFEILFDDMIENEACGGVVSRRASALKQRFQSNPEYFDSVKGNAEEQTDFLDSPRIQRALTGTHALNRSFHSADIKRSENGISVYLCLPQEEEKIYSRWQRLMIYTLTRALVKNAGRPANGHQVLFSLDEFLSLSRMERIEDGMEAIAGAGGKMFISVQKFGRLKSLYGKNWESFISGAGVQIWFNPDAQECAQYLEKALGEAEVVRIAESTNRSESRQETHGTTITIGTTVSDGTSDTVSQGTAKTKGWTQNRFRSRQWQRGTHSSSNSGRSYEPHFLFQPLESGTQYGAASGSNEGVSGGSGEGSARSGSVTQQTGTAQTTNKSTAKTQQTAKQDSVTTGEQTGEGAAETFHKKALLTVNEMNVLLADRRDIEDVRYPGFALIRIPGEDPFVVRKCFYDQDVAFAGKFSKHPDNPFIPHDRQPLLAYQATEAHFCALTMPPLLRKVGFEERLKPWITVGTPIQKIGGANVFVRPAAFDKTGRLFGKVIDIAADEEFAETGVVAIVRGERPISEADAAELANELWGEDIIQAKQTIAGQIHEEQEKIDRLNQELAKQSAHTWLTDDRNSLEWPSEYRHPLVVWSFPAVPGLGFLLFALALIPAIFAIIVAIGISGYLYYRMYQFKSNIENEMNSHIDSLNSELRKSLDFISNLEK